MATLVVIPALIVIVAVGVAFVFGSLTATHETLEDQVLRLRQSSGAGKLPLGLRDPRYKARFQAAANLAEMMRDVSAAQRPRLTAELIEILDDSVEPQEEDIQRYLLAAIARLGQDQGLRAILARQNAPDPGVREWVATATGVWLDAVNQAGEPITPALHAEAVAVMVKLSNDASPLVARPAVMMLGLLTTPNDSQAISALRAAMATTGSDRQEVGWNAAVALARLNDLLGSQRVAQVLLDRHALSELIVGGSGPGSHEKLSVDQQTRVILSTLAAAEGMNDPHVWARIDELSESDPDRGVRHEARKLILARERP
jgi:hypothetical protein